MTITNSSFLFTQFYDKRNRIEQTSNLETGEISVIEIPIDATITEQHGFESTITKDEVEDGSEITDHIHNENPTLSMLCTISNTPIRFLAGIRNAVRNDGVSPVQNAWTLLKQLRDTRQPFTVVTGLETYENMAIARLGVPIDSGTGEQLRFNIDLEQVNIVSSLDTFIAPAEKDASAPTVDKGTQAPPPATEKQAAAPTRRISALKRLTSTSVQ